MRETANVCALQIRLGRDLKQGKCWESLGHGVGFLEVHSMCLIPSPNLLRHAYSP